MKTGLDQYTDIITYAVKNSAAKLTKSFEKILIEVIILYMIIPRKVNFTQMERYGSHDEQTYKKTPHIGRFWSGCAQAVKHGLEIMGTWP